MANVSKPTGFRPVKHTTGAPYNGQANLYYVSSASSIILAGDPVKYGGTADANGIATVDRAAAGDTPVGIVVGILNSKFDPVGKLTTGSTALDIPALTQVNTGAAAYVLVADAPDLVMEVETSGTTALVDVGLNANLALGSRTTSTTVSPAVLDMSTKATTATLIFNLIGYAQRVDNDPTSTGAKALVTFNVHQFKSVGTAGIA
jgi:hypothetical protein